jgi:hypothetical protein
MAARKSPEDSAYVHRLDREPIGLAGLWETWKAHTARLSITDVATKIRENLIRKFVLRWP